VPEIYRHGLSVLAYLLPPFPPLALGDSALASLWGPVIATVVGLPAVVLAYRQATNARKSAEQIEAKRVDAEAYERAQRLMEKGIQQLEDQVTRLKAEQVERDQQFDAQVSRLKSELLERDHEVMALRTRVRELEDQVVMLRRTAAE
jgi:hypothetical protein